MKTLADTTSLPGLAELIAERHRLGLDGHDEVWGGVYHVSVIAPSEHGDIQAQLLIKLATLAAPRGLVVSGPVNIGLGENDHRVPDVVVLRQRTDLVWVPTAAMVVEVRSPGDETYEKFGFYYARGVEEILVVDPANGDLRLFGHRAAEYERIDASLLLGAAVTHLAQGIVWPHPR
jgi:hypothetical protein